MEADLEKKFDKYSELPTKFDVNDYHIMEEFIWDLSEGEMQDKLERAIQGHGAFRRFKDMVYNLDIEQKWFDFEGEYHKKIAIEWCKDNSIKYTWCEENGIENKR